MGRKRGSQTMCKYERTHLHCRCSLSHMNHWPLTMNKKATASKSKQINRCRRQFDWVGHYSGHMRAHIVYWKHRVRRANDFATFEYNINCTFVRTRWLRFFATSFVFCFSPLCGSLDTHPSYLYKILGHRPMSIALRLINVMMEHYICAPAPSRNLSKYWIQLLSNVLMASKWSGISD